MLQAACDFGLEYKPRSTIRMIRLPWKQSLQSDFAMKFTIQGHENLTQPATSVGAQYAITT